jgi:hypothetical protein
MMQNYQTLQGYVADLPTSRSSIWISSPLHFMLLVHQLLCPHRIDLHASDFMTTARFSNDIYQREHIGIHLSTTDVGV